MLPVYTLASFAPKLSSFSNGVSLPKGYYFSHQQLQLSSHLDIRQNVIQSSITPLQLWPDNSIKWINITGVVSKKLQQGTTLYVCERQHDIAHKRLLWVTEHASHIEIETQTNIVCIDKKQLFGISHLCVNAPQHTHEAVLTGAFTCEAKPVDILAQHTQTHYQIHYDQHEHPLYCQITQMGEMYYNNSHKLEVSIYYTVFYATSKVEVTYSVRNPKAVIPMDGKWDLGNPNRVDIAQLKFTFDYVASALSAHFTDSNTQAKTIDNLEHINIDQASSGGKNWKSFVYKSKHNKVEISQDKPEVTYNHVGAPVQSADLGQRISPSVYTQLRNSQFVFTPHHFWEKFPSELDCNLQQLSICYVDRNTRCNDIAYTELQPGESKSHAFSYSLSHISDAAHLAPIKLNIIQEHAVTSGALAFNCNELEQHPLYRALNIQNSASIEGWIAKREALDEYGWRNFGDLYADHEAAGYSGEMPFVSHYNNQYDPLLGFLHQWILKADYKYRILADELFDHVINIDIYQTNEDKPEYNYGLFWHTDHYLQAETATHRTYSKHQAKNVYMDHAGGGGPGSHHCYSSGLTLYYCLSGNDRAKQTVLRMATWMRHIFEGDGTLLNLLIRVRNSNYLRIPFTQKLLLGFGTTGSRNVFTNQYPLDRGTANYTNVLLDAYALTLGKHFLHQAEYALVHTISDADDISARNFEDIENTWFYTVLLQAAIKYLKVMFDQQIETTTSAAIRKAFLHYAMYVAHHEQHYLASPSVLEYPNETWTGQDLRKIHILFAAHSMTALDNTESVYSIKAQQICEVVYTRLLESEETETTRIQALIMQNIADQPSINAQFRGYAKWVTSVQATTVEPLVGNFVGRVIRFIKQYSIKQEWRFMKVRLFR